MPSTESPGQKLQLNSTKCIVVDIKSIISSRACAQDTHRKTVDNSGVQKVYQSKGKNHGRNVREDQGHHEYKEVLRDLFGNFHLSWLPELQVSHHRSRKKWSVVKKLSSEFNIPRIKMLLQRSHEHLHDINYAMKGYMVHDVPPPLQTASLFALRKDA